MEQTQQKVRPAHCLVFPYPMQGHINPMLQFSKRLEEKGIKVTLVTTKSMFKSLHKTSESMALETISDGYDEGRKVADITDDYVATFKQVGSETLSNLIEKLNTTGSPVDCIVYDSGFPWVIDIAKRFGLVGAEFFTQSCAVDNIYYNVHHGLLELPVVGHQVLIPGLPALEPTDLPTFLYQQGSNLAIYNVVLSQFLDIDKVDWMLCNTFDKLEEKAIRWMSKQLPIKAIGPTIPMKYLQDEKRLQDDEDNTLHLYKPDVGACMNWLNERQDGSVVYVAFGSLAELNDQQMEELAWGLKQSDKYFLWVVRPSEEPKLPKDFVKETSDKGLVVQWCSQLDVLAHKAIGCFVTHCGWNSTLEAISLGVPMVAVPRWSDQTTNAKYVADVWKMGVKAKTDEKGMITRDVMDFCIREVMDGKKGKELKRNVKKWMEMAREAVKEGGSSDKWINEFVDDIIQHSKSGRF